MRRLLPVLCWVVGCTGTVGDVLVPVAPDLGSLDAKSDAQPDSGGCVHQTLGSPSGAMCLDSGSWIMIAIQTCGQGGLVLEDFMLLYPGSTGGTCGAATFGGVACVCCPQN